MPHRSELDRRLWESAVQCPKYPNSNASRGVPHWMAGGRKTVVKSPSTASNTIEATYRQLTPTSAELMQRAAQVLPGGSTRTVGWFDPYPVVFQRGEGPYLIDADGRSYIDLFCNGLSLIHGHAYPAIVETMARVAQSGTAWPGASQAQIEFAELLAARIPSGGLVRFTNTGTEAAMLAVKLARYVTGRPAVLKTWGGYHGSYDDLEAGLHGQGEIPGRTWLSEFNDLASFERAFESHGAEIAAVMVESVMYTGVVVTPDPGFLNAVQDLARRHGALLILDDCLMFRLAEGGSAEKYGLVPDLTVLGKFVGGGTPVGAVVGDPEILGVLDPHRRGGLYHGGSFNGNVLGTACGAVAMRGLTGDRIAMMDDGAAHMRASLEAHADRLGLPLVTSGEGSAFGAYLTGNLPNPDGLPLDSELSRRFQLAAVNHGVLFGNGNEFALATVTEPAVVEVAIDRLCAALDDVAGSMP
jgi:glutamate-1-semialdehyde 2,1-aminomutase